MVSGVTDSTFSKTPYQAADKIRPLSNSEWAWLILSALKDVVIVLVLSVYVYCKIIYNLIVPPEKKKIGGWTALVTGAGSGTGKAVAIELAKEGCNVAVVDSDGAAAKSVAKSLERYNVKAVGYQVDVSDADSVEKLKVRIEADLAPVDLLVNNTSVVPVLPFLKQTLEDIDRIINVNTVSHFFILKTFLLGMMERKKGHVVTISSMAALQPISNGTIYCATHAANNGLAKSVEQEIVLSGHEDHVYSTIVYAPFSTTKSSSKEDKFEINNPEEVAKATVDAILINKRYVTVPWYKLSLVGFLSTLPHGVQLIVKSQFPAQ